jgi:hypothetical protein
VLPFDAADVTKCLLSGWIQVCAGSALNTVFIYVSRREFLLPGIGNVLTHCVCGTYRETASKKSVLSAPRQVLPCVHSTATTNSAAILDCGIETAAFRKKSQISGV